MRLRFILGGAALGSALLIWAWRFFSWPCPSWLVPLLENPYFQAVANARTLIDRAGVEAGMTVLDAGCGPGRMTLPAAERVGPTGKVVALDVQESMLSRLDQRLEDAGVENVGLLHAGLGNGRLPRDRFDAAFLVTVLGETPDPVATLAELRDALVPGGCLSITEVLPDPHYQTLPRVRRYATEAGLEEGRVWRRWHGFTLNLHRP